MIIISLFFADARALLHGILKKGIAELETPHDDDEEIEEEGE